MSGIPYTHEMHAKACQSAAQSKIVLRQWVQVRTSGSTHCARLIDAWTSSDGCDFWKVQATEPLAFTGSYPVRAVRQCSGIDGRCICSGEACETSAPGRAELAMHEPGADVQPTPQGVTCV